MYSRGFQIIFFPVMSHKANRSHSLHSMSVLLIQETANTYSRTSYTPYFFPSEVTGGTLQNQVQAYFPVNKYWMCGNFRWCCSLLLYRHHQDLQFFIASYPPLAVINKTNVKKVLWVMWRRRDSFIFPTFIISCKDISVHLQNGSLCLYSLQRNRKKKYMSRVHFLLYNQSVLSTTQSRICSCSSFCQLSHNMISTVSRNAYVVSKTR